MSTDKFRDVDHLLNQKPFRDFKSEINDYVNDQLKNVILSFDKKYIVNNKKEVIQNMIKYNVDGNWVERLKNGDKYKKDGFSMESLIVKYGESVAKLISQERNNKVAVTKDKYLKNHTEKEWEELCNKKRSNLGKNGYIKKYGNEIGLEKWNNYLKKWKVGIEKKKADGWKNGLTLDEYQDKYGMKEGYKKWRKRIDDRKYTLSLDGFVNKYGIVEGRKKYYEHIDRMIKNCRTNKSYSKISQELFDKIYNLLKDSYKKNTKYYTLNEEQKFFIHSNIKTHPKIIFVDFKCGNVIIEFDGSYWHSFKHVRDRDKIRDEFLIKNNYKVLRISERDYLKDKNGIVENCLNFIKENYK